MATHLFKQYVEPPSPGDPPDPYATGGLRVWDDYQFRRKGVKGAGGAPLERPNTAPVNRVPPVVSGIEIQDQTLSCTTGVWTGTAPIIYTYQWYHSAGLTTETDQPITDEAAEQLDGGANTPILGATSSTYVLQPSDVGTNIYCMVTASNVAGSAAARSNTTGQIEAIVVTTPPVSLTAPMIDDPTPTEGIELHVTDGTWAGTTPMTFIYEWHAVDPAAPGEGLTSEGEALTVDGEELTT